MSLVWNCIILAFCFKSIVGKPNDGLLKVSPELDINDDTHETVPTMPTLEKNLEIKSHLKSILSEHQKDKPTFPNGHILSENGRTPPYFEDHYDGSETADETRYSEPSLQTEDGSLSNEKSTTRNGVPFLVHLASLLTDSTGSSFENNEGNSFSTSSPYPILYGETKATEAENVSACLQKRETGVCRAYIPRWYYNISTGTCNKFVYGGCKGNQNNFLKEHHCYAKCTGEVPCPTDPEKKCKVYESACLNTTCPTYPDAECFILPCTCEPAFEDRAGNIVDCNMPVVEVYEGRAASGEGSSILPVLPEQNTTHRTISGAAEPSINNSSDPAQNSSAPESTTAYPARNSSASESTTAYVPGGGDVDVNTSSASPTEHRPLIPDPPITDKPNNNTAGPITSQVHTVILSLAAVVLIIILIVLMVVGYLKYRRAMNFDLRTRYSESQAGPAERECFTSKTSLTEDYGTGV